VVAREVEAGSWLQVNGFSVTGGYGETVESAAVELLAGGRPVVLSSDAHSETRPPCLAQAARAAHGAHVEPGRIRIAIDDGPRRLLESGLPTKSLVLRH
jgi:tyrosine-protein phosphatase YwqE